MKNCIFLTPNYAFQNAACRILGIYYLGLYKKETDLDGQIKFREADIKTNFIKDFSGTSNDNVYWKLQEEAVVCMVS